MRSFDNELVEGWKRQQFRNGQLIERLLGRVLSRSGLAFVFATLSLVSSASAQTTTTFRGHTLGESWQTFIRTEGGLCRLGRMNAVECEQAAAGKKASLTQLSKENDGYITFNFEAGRFVRADGFMKGPKFAELTFLEKTYGKPSSKSSNPEKGIAISLWDFSDGGKVEATESTDSSGQAIILVSVSGKAPSKRPVAGSNADDVCSFIVGKIRQAVPEVSTMCHVGEASKDLRYDVTVFSTVDVLQGKLRRAWSTALFDATQDLFYGTALGRACNASAEGVYCRVFFSDSEMARSWGGRHYMVSNVPGMGQFLYGDPSSDKWYRSWWDMAISDETFEHAGAQGSAEWAGKQACEMYADALRHDPQFRQDPKGLPIPTCSVLLATNLVVFIQVDFPGPGMAASFGNYADPLPETFGEVFRQLPYKGIVTFRGSWMDMADGPMRVMKSYDLRNLEFLYEEVHSGLRSATEASDHVQVSLGQIDKYTLTKDAHDLGGVVNVTPRSDGRSLIKLTGGSQWSVLQTCQPNEGDILVLVVQPSGKLVFMNQTQDFKCAPKPEFVGSW